MISVCMIVKNEEKWIREAIENYKGISEQIIVVDTGSTDNTKAIAAELGAEVYDFEWNGNFSDARNFSLTKATCEWILSLDADERIAPESFKAIRNYTENPHIQAVRFNIRNYSNDPTISGYKPRSGEFASYETGYFGYFISRRVKLFKNFENIKYEGRVHELVETYVTGVTLDAQTPIHHYGHIDQEVERKSKDSVYLESLRSKVMDKATDWTAWFQLGVAKIKANLYEEAIPDLEKALSLRKTAMAFSHLGVCFSKLGRLDEAQRTYELGLTLFGEDLDLIHNFAVLKVEKGDWIEAADLYQKIMEQYPTSYLGYRGFGFTLLNLNRVDQARPVLERCLELFPEYEDAKIDMAIVCLSEGNQAEARKYADSVLSTNPTSPRGLGLAQTINQMNTV